MEEEAHEERLKLVQDVRVYPVGRVLRETFDAENHDTLGSDVAGLMIDLSRVPFGPPTAEAMRAAALAPAHRHTSQRPQGVMRSSPVRRLVMWLRGR